MIDHMGCITIHWCDIMTHRGCKIVHRGCIMIYRVYMMIYRGCIVAYRGCLIVHRAAWLLAGSPRAEGTCPEEGPKYVSELGAGHNSKRLQ